MSYTKTTWSDGDVITAEKLNNIESGVESASSGSILVVHSVEGTLDKTWQEICDAIENAIPAYVYIELNDEYYGQGTFVDRIDSIAVLNNKYRVSTNNENYSASSPSGYPQQVQVRD